jgi:hypothetical protein
MTYLDMVLQNNLWANSSSGVEMVRINHGGLHPAHKAAPQHYPPPPYTFVAGDYNFPTKKVFKSAGFSPDPSKATL